MKIGIVTHYYKSENYGGNLQAYALCKVLNDMGHEAEQISLDKKKDKGLYLKFKELGKKILLSLKRNRKLVKARSLAFRGFNQEIIPHSIAYSEKSIRECVQNYDAFITGSDQVWNPRDVCDAYLLRFAPSDKIKLSYAASIARNQLSQEIQERYKRALLDYKAISVRENEAVPLIAPLTDKDVRVVLDPTLLLTKEDWLSMAEPSGIKEDYLFCYFLGNNERSRKLAEEYAKKNNLKIVTLPHLIGKRRKCDDNFGDYKLYDVSPQRLIGLINEAKCVFTDSFHATVFSIICQKEYFVFHRSALKTMSSRIYTLTSLFGTKERFCDCESKESIGYIESLDKIDYSCERESYIKLREESIGFLKGNL